MLKFLSIMKISYKWLKNYVDCNLPAEQVAAMLTDCGLEVESLDKFESVKGGLEGIVVGEVKTCFKHPDADRLHVTTVDVGAKDLLNIVCGAPNVSAGQKVLVALVGTKLFMKNEVITIGKTRIRGVDSEGMICAEDELGLGTSHDGIMVLDSDVKVGISARDHFQVFEDDIFEIGLTPNRADATSHIGVARDLCAVLNVQFGGSRKLRFPEIGTFRVNASQNNFKIIIEEPDLCPRYTGLYIKGVDVKESPKWLKNALLSIGMRPINNVVDITNFVLYECGQPLHAFDADSICGEKIIVKRLPKGTKFKTLDEEERELNGEELMICNEEEGMVIAGVFGGVKSGVTEDTKNVFLESACFNPQSIRKTSRFHGLNTDASFRFERGSDPEITLFAIKRAAVLIQEIAGGAISSEVIDEYPRKYNPGRIHVSFSDIDRLTGHKIDRQMITDILKWINVSVWDISESGFSVFTPSNKPDITREVDIIEEILRIYGYNRIELPDGIRTSVTYRPLPDREEVKDAIANLLTSNGYFEIMNNSLTNSVYYSKFPALKENENVRLLNPNSKELDMLRQTLLFGGLETIAYNLNHKMLNLKLFETGNVYYGIKKGDGDSIESKFLEKEKLAVLITGNENPESWRSTDRKSDFFTLKSTVFSILERLGIPSPVMDFRNTDSDIFVYGLQAGKKGEASIMFGLLNSSFNKFFDIRQDVFYAEFDLDYLIRLQTAHKTLYQELPKYPEVRRDLALLLDRNIHFADIENLAFITESNLLRKVQLFDVYEGDKIGQGMKSYAVSFFLQDMNKTLTDNVIDGIMNKLISVFQKELGAKIR